MKSDYNYIPSPCKCSSDYQFLLVEIVPLHRDRMNINSLLCHFLVIRQRSSFKAKTDLEERTRKLSILITLMIRLTLQKIELKMNFT